MKYIILKNERIPKLGFGTWTVGDNPKDKEKEINALNVGYEKFQMNLIDTAEMYGEGASEKVVGEFLKNKNRDDFFIVNKILPSNAKKGLYLERCKNSLEIMGLDYFDLYLLHWKSNVNLQEMVDNMETLVNLGLIKHWGVSNFDVHEMEELFRCKNGNHCFANQCLFNVLARGVEYDLIDWCDKHDVLFMAYSPLGNNSIDRNQVTKNKDFIKIAEDNNMSPESLMLNFVIRYPIVMAVFKTSSINHLENNMKNVFNTLDQQSLSKIDKIFPPVNKKIPLEKI